MTSPRALVMSGIQHDLLRKHLFPGDNLEAAAVLLCSRSGGATPRLLVRDVIEIPYSSCRVREADRVVWPGAYLETALDKAEPNGLTLVLIHSHPRGFFQFSPIDDCSDQEVMPGLLENHGSFHCTAIMTPDGAVQARSYGRDLSPRTFDSVCVMGNDIVFWWGDDAVAGIASQRPVAFTSGMANELRRLTAMVVGVSGTGSLLAEQALRLGFGHVKLVDFDHLEIKNLNRIINSTKAGADQSRLKVEMFAEAAAAYRESSAAEPIPLSILSRQAVFAASECDVLFCCVDSLEARRVLDLIAASFVLPLIDVGVTIPTRLTNTGFAIGDVCGRIDYIQPGRSSLKDRGVYTAESLRAEYLRRNAPEAHQEELEAGYIKGVIEEAPGVISLNMRASAASMNEFIARAYPFRHEPNDRYARTLFSLAACEEEYVGESEFTCSPNAVLSRGDQEPLLGLPALSTDFLQ